MKSINNIEGFSELSHDELLMIDGGEGFWKSVWEGIQSFWNGICDGFDAVSFKY